ncbi:hypothetical protein GGX14DRAFT_406392 [Mycena pura]|uniref:Uncharacterized protein n=1 Tax=Mycena pura TaxID=153505 RepID=A0AAD6UTG5_9AGAR|nr:hypothetical protein GGX14DRAFT_406392 [Mycena pura]
MNRPSGISRAVNTHLPSNNSTEWNADSQNQSLYGGGAPHGNPFPPAFKSRLKLTGLLTCLHQRSPGATGTRAASRRVAGVEENVSQLQARIAPLPARRAGGWATRSRRPTSSKPATSVPAHGSDESDTDVAPRSTTDLSATDLSATDLSATDLSMDTEESEDLSKLKKRALKSYVTKVFRLVCNVPGRNWPDALVERKNSLTDEVYPTPVFTEQVTDLRNRAIFEAVAKQVMLELEDRNFWPRNLKRLSGVPGPRWDLALLTNFAKDSLRGFKRQWKEFQEIEAAIRAESGRGNNRRRLKHRKRKSGQLTKVLKVFEFATQYKLDPIFEGLAIGSRLASVRVPARCGEAIGGKAVKRGGEAACDITTCDVAGEVERRNTVVEEGGHGRATPIHPAVHKWPTDEGCAGVLSSLQAVFPWFHSGAKLPPKK